MSKANSGNGNSGFKPRNNLGRSTLECDYFHLKGHTNDTCYKLHGYPVDFKAKRRGYSGPEDLLSVKVMWIGKEEFGLYILKPDISKDSVQFQDAKQSTSLVSSVNTVSNFSNNKAIHTKSTENCIMSLWNKRLGHAPMKVLQKISSLPHIPMQDHHYTVCPIAKQSRLPFLHSTSCSTHPFEIVHTDVWGPYRVPTHDGKRYFMTLVDDFSKYTWLFLMNTKAESIVVLKMFLTLVQTQFDSKVKCLRSGNGIEFFNEQGASPFEKLYNKVPSLQHLRVFGSMCYASSARKVDKFSPKAISVVHLGYSSMQKGYILYDLHSKLIFVSRDTVSKENVFSFKHVTSNSSPLFPILDLSEADCSSLNCIPTPGNPITESLPSVYSQLIDPSQLVPDHHPQLSSSTAADPPPIRKSSRTYVPPIWLKDYVLPSKGAVCNYSISNYVCYDKLSPAYQACLTAYSAVSEPTSYVEASTDPKWIEAMRAGIVALEEN
ncbi:uncharacterized protein LOC107796600 [Nicotiana tabacum]|uniref:Uncharacterized protein LOC107796600 n=1 Tax=Nicotiana tabacum TaxID=4097 RepID=A0A1S4AE27_TOBAC|nr:PREDICTED: uncharacterized protein LOC107796600 [Nicotiana tabacum]